MPTRLGFLGFVSCSCVLTLSMTGAIRADGGAEPPPCDVPEGTVLPDLRTVVPTHVGLQNAHQREILRFSNGIANLGRGLWWMEPVFPLDDAPEDEPQLAFQVFSSTDLVTDEGPPAVGGNVTGKCEKGRFEFHPTHNHWHIDQVADFRLCSEASFLAARAEGRSGQCVPFGQFSVKVTFCLIDWYKLGDNTATSDPTRNFFACETGFQGVSPGWVDQYHQSTDDQQIDITFAPEGTYYLVSTANHEGLFEEADSGNNTSWLVLELTRSSNGNPKLEAVGDACDDDDYLASLVASVIAFAPGDPDRQERILIEMCGGKPANR